MFQLSVQFVINKTQTSLPQGYDMYRGEAIEKLVININYYAHCIYIPEAKNVVHVFY